MTHFTRLLATWPVMLCCVFTLSAQQSSLFHRAVELDSLYTALDEGDKSAADAFFDVLRTLYNAGDELDDSAIRSDFTGNAYVDRKVGIVFNELSLRDDARGRLVERLYLRRDSFLRVAIVEAESFCNARIEETGRCAITPILRDLATAPKVSKLQNLRKAATNEALQERIQGIELEIYDIDRRLEREETIAQTILQLNAEAGSSQPFGQTATTSLTPLPIVVESGGPSSLQASVLDGASKWIAQRMREELSIAFFDRFEAWIENENIRILFPNTFNAIGNSMTVDYSLMLQVFKTAFEKDLAVLPFAMGNYLRLEMEDGTFTATANRKVMEAYDSLRVIQGKEEKLYAEQEAAQNRYNSLKLAQKRGEDVDLDEINEAELDLMLAELTVGVDVELSKILVENMLEEAEASVETNDRILKYVLFTMDAINELRKGEHPSTLLGYLGGRVDELFPQTSNLKPALLVMDVISRSLISPGAGDGKVWVSGKDLDRLRRGEQLREFFFGLIYHEIKQNLRRNRNDLEKEMRDLAYDLTDGAFTLESYRYASETDYAVRSALRYYDVELVNVTRQRTEELAGELLEQNFTELSDPRSQATVVAALLDYQSRLRPLANGYAGYDPAEIRRLRQSTRGARNVMDRRLEELATKTGADAEQLEDWKETARYCLNLDGGVTDEAVEVLPAKAYRDQIDYELNGIHGFFLEEDDLADRLKLIVQPAAEAYVAERVYRDRFASFLEEQRDQVFERIHREFVVRDSLAIEREAILAVPENRMLHLKADRITDQQTFIDGMLLDNPRAFGDLVSEFVGFADRFDLLQAEYRGLRQAGNANLGSTQFVFLLRSSMDLLQNVFTLALPEDTESLETVNFLTNNVLDAYTGVLEKDYDAVLMNIVPVANRLVDLHFDALVNGAGEDRRLVDSLRARQADRQLKIQEIFRYGAFLAAVAEARNSEEIKNAIRAIALPAGSYSIKRRAVGNISLNAYPGITGGAELANGGGIDAWGGNFGFTAPLGLAFSWGYRSRIDAPRYLSDRKYQRRVDKSPFLPNQRFLNGSSGSLFFPLIDLGALVLFRLDSATEPLPEDVGFQQVFSPGVIYSHGFANLPLSVMAGMQVSPQLRKFGDQRANAFRFNLGLTVDLPMINFHTKRTPTKE